MSWPPLCVGAVVFAVVAADVHALNSLNTTIIIINLLIDGQTARSFGLGRRLPLTLSLHLSRSRFSLPRSTWRMRNMLTVPTACYSIFHFIALSTQLYRNEAIIRI